MSKKEWLAAVAMSVLIGVMAITMPSKAATTGDQQPKMRYGQTLVLASAATKVFTGMIGRNAFAIYNNGPNPIYCAHDTAVTTSTGYPVPAGTSLSVDITYPSSQSTDFYCIAATADQAGALGTRYLQVK